MTPPPPVVSDGRMDFSNQGIPVSFPPNPSSDATSVSIATIDDFINEATEGYLIAIIVENISPADEGTGVIFERGGLALVRIRDDDGVLVCRYIQSMLLLLLLIYC